MRTLRLDLRVRPLLRPIVQPNTRFVAAVAHRRAGKTVGAVQSLLLDALNCPLEAPRLAYVAPTYKQAKRVAWDYLKSMAAPVLAKPPHESELRLDLVNGARIQLFGAENAEGLRGVYLDKAVLDEYADMASSVWPEIIRPALADRRGRALFIGTPKGRNDFHRIVQRAGVEPDWTQVILRASQTGYIAAEELATLQREMTPDQYAQEFECSFNAAVAGAYYAREIERLEAEGRVTSVPYDPALPVFTAWDLGISDATAIWFFQVAAGQVRVIDFYQSQGHGLEHYAKVLRGAGYGLEKQGREYLPHDARARELGTGRTREETLRNLLGRQPFILPQHSVMDGINAGRLTLARAWFDAERCGEGLEMLRQYRAEWDDKARVFRDRPLHDFTSHAADGWRYLSMAWREMAPPARPKPKPDRYALQKGTGRATGWAA